MLSKESINENCFIIFVEMQQSEIDKERIMADKRENSEEMFLETCTIDNYDELEETFGEKYFKKETELFEYQLKTTTYCIDAEKCNGVKTKIYNPSTSILQGTGICKSKIGALALSTGAGKCLISYNIATQDIEEQKEEFIYSSALMNVKMTPEKNRPILSFSVFVVPKTLVNKWKEEAEKFLKSKYYKVIGKKSEFQTELDNCELPEDFEITYDTIEGEEYNCISKELKDLKKEKKSLKNQIKNLEEDSQEYIIIDERIHLLEKERIKLEKERLKLENFFKVPLYIKNEMKKKKFLICSAESFYLLIPIFKCYRVERLFIDEPQAISITNQDTFRNNSFFECLDFLENPNSIARVPFRENSPALFIWLISATIHQITENEKAGKTKKGPAKYFNMWIGRNCPMFRDYINSVKGNYRMPEFTKRYVVKLPRSFVIKKMFGKKKMYKRINLKIKRPQLLFQVEGLFENQEQGVIVNLIANDDNEGLCAHFGIESLENLSDGMIEFFNKKIKDVQDKKNITKLVGEGLINYINNCNDKIEKYEEKIKRIRMKQEKLKPQDGEEETTCYICMCSVVILPEQKNKKDYIDNNSSIICSNCGIVSHIQCTHLDMKTRKQNQCGYCKCNFEKNKPCFLVKSSNETYREVKETEIENEDEDLSELIPVRNSDVFNDKIEAFNYCLEKSGNKILIFTNLSKGEGETLTKIVIRTIKAGYKVTLPRLKTREELRRIYGKRYEPSIKCIKTQTDTAEEVSEFRNSEENSAWILDSFTTSAGLDFEFVNSIICYSNFSSITQIIGRGLRMDRTIKFKVFVLNYETTEEEKIRLIEEDEENA